jgi:LuxR family maltose regulon positive regulatory protein
MAGLLRQLRRQGIAPHYIEQILTAFPDSAVPEIVLTDTDLPEPLTNRELEILALLSEGLTNKEIAAQLVVSPGTVTQHTHKIYQKLMVKNRRLAVIEATKLGILPRV